MRVALIDWYRAHRRDLPWRRTADPYAIWISEIMLQQTRVAAVIPYYEKFLAAFPDAAALAAAPEEQVLAQWAGLGYYSRAHNLQKACKILATLPAFPCDYSTMRALPGIGDYTAAAISSIAFGLPHAAVDGNVRRVVVRLTNNDDADAQSHADRLLDREDPGRWNQAMMELGATVCTPRDPQCGACPLAQFCGARRYGTAVLIPSKKIKPAPERLQRKLLLIEHRRRLLLVPSVRVPGFWDLPEKFPGAVRGVRIGEFRHTIQHRHYRFEVHTGVLRSAAAPGGERIRWAARQKLHEIPLSTTAKKALRCLKDRYVDSSS